jgi:very-short-patch-repair endonuclease
MNTATPSLRATPSNEGEFKTACLQIERTANTSTPPVGHPFILKGNVKRSDLIPLQYEGVARSDGVADFKGADEVAAAKTNRKLNELPYNPALKQRAKELRKAGNLSEALFWSVVKNRQLNGLDFDRQRVIGNYIVDFYCHEYALVVEIDGSSHDDKQEYDLIRDQYLEALGLKVLHVQDVDVKQNLSGVVEVVLEQIQLPRRCAPPLQVEGELIQVLRQLDTPSE